MADDMEDIEDMLEAPYKNIASNVKEHADHKHHKSDSEDETSSMKNGSEKVTNGKSGHNGVDEHMEHESNENNEKATSGDGVENKTEKEDVSKSSKSKESSSSSSKKSRKDKSRSRSRSSKHKKRSRSRSRSKKSRKRSRSRDRKRTRSRSRSKDRRRRTRSRSRSARRRRSSRSRSRDGSRHRRHRYSPSHRRRSRDRTPPPPRERTPELTPEERDQRTVFCMQLSARIRPRDLEDFFSAVGKVKDVRLITDPRTKRSKGIAYIEFKDVDSVPLAIALTGQRLLGVPIIVKLTQAEKNRLPFTGPHIPANLPQDGPIKLYVGSLHVNISEEMLRGIFEPFGHIDQIAISRDEIGRSKGYGFIQFANAEDGKKAMEQLNNFELANKPIKVSLFISEKAFETGPTATNLDNDELDRTGVNLGPSGKLALMAKLAEGTGLKLPDVALNALNMTSTTAPNVAPITQNGYSPSTVPVASQCFVLTNMFDLEEEKTKPNWVDEIREDVIDECAKYGGIVHIHVDEHAPDGNVYIKCPSIAIANAAMSGLHGRYFGKKMIKASSIPIATYHKEFPESINCVNVLHTES